MGKLCYYSENVQQEFVPNRDKTTCDCLCISTKRFNCLCCTHIVLILLVGTFVMGLALYNGKPFRKLVGQGTVSTRVDGVLDTSNVDILALNMNHSILYARIWTPQDYLYPRTQRHMSDFNIMTNVVMIPNQTMGYCPGTDIEDLVCATHSDCDPTSLTQQSVAGVLTGKCTNRRCEIHGYCPPYIPGSSIALLPFNGTKALLEDADTDVVILIKSAIEFPDIESQEHNFWNFRQRDSAQSFLENCFYPELHQGQYCPRFKIGDVVRMAGSNFKETAITGGIFKILTEFECKFAMEIGFFNIGPWNIGPSPTCQVTYSFKRMDTGGPHVALGWYYDCSIQVDEDRRHFRECYGLKILTEVQGRGKQPTLSGIIIDMILSSVNVLFVPALIISWIVLKCCVDKTTLKDRTVQDDHPKIVCCWNSICRKPPADSEEPKIVCCWNSETPPADSDETLNLMSKKKNIAVETDSDATLNLISKV